MTLPFGGASGESLPLDRWFPHAYTDAMLKNFQYRLYPTKKQQKTLETLLDACRFLYNKLLEMRKIAYERDGISLSCFQQQQTYSVLKEQHPILREVHSQVLQNVAVRVDLAFKAFFRRCKTRGKPGYPRFKGSGRYDSLTYPQSGFRITSDGRVYLSKIGTLNMVYHREIAGRIKTCTLHRSTTHKWYVTFAVECDPIRLEENEVPVGIDVGLKTFATLSSGQEIANPRFFRQEEKALAKAQRKLSTHKQGSWQRRKQRKVVARVHERTKWRRSNFTHHHSRQIVKHFGIICVEDLHIKGMLHNHCLAKSISDAAWSQFFAQLSSKAAEAGREFLRVNPAHTTQDCSRCRHRQPMPLSERTYQCPRCELVIDRDLNASYNIVGLGLQSRVVPEAPVLEPGE